MTKNTKNALEEYLNLVKKNKSTVSGLQPTTTFTLKLPKNVNEIKVKVFDSLNIGSDSKNTCSINELMNHIEWVKNTPNCYAILGGDLFYSFDKQEQLGNTTFHTEKQLEILQTLFEPIKDRIIGIIGGKNEEIILRKEGVDATKLLASRLDLLDRYNPNNILITVKLNNSYTDNLPLELNISCSSIYTRAQLYATIYKRSLQAGKRIGNADLNITTCTRRCMKSDSKIHDYSTRLGDLIRKPHYEYNSSGYCMWGKKGEGPYFIDNNILTLYMSKNKDANIIQGTNEVKEVPYKVFCDIEPIGKIEQTKKQYSVIADYYQLKKSNEDLFNFLIKTIQDLNIEVNNSVKKSLFENLYENNSTKEVENDK